MSIGFRWERNPSVSILWHYDTGTILGQVMPWENWTWLARLKGADGFYFDNPDMQHEFAAREDAERWLETVARLK